MRSRKVIFLMLFEGLGPWVPQGGPKDPSRPQKVAPKVQKVVPKPSKLGLKAIKRRQKNENAAETLAEYENVADTSAETCVIYSCAF